MEGTDKEMKKYLKKLVTVIIVGLLGFGGVTLFKFSCDRPEIKPDFSKEKRSAYQKSSPQGQIIMGDFIINNYKYDKDTDTFKLEAQDAVTGNRVKLNVMSGDIGLLGKENIPFLLRSIADELENEDK